MVTWNITIGLMLLSAAIPLIYLHYRLVALRERAREDIRELEYLREMREELEKHVRNDKALFLEALGVPFLLVRPSGRLVMSNRAAGELLGIEPESSVNLIRTLPDCELRRVVEEAVAARRRVESTLRLTRRGREYVYRTTATPLGNVDRHIGIVFHDITEMQRAQLIRREFVANASHELRTPLTIIRGYLENLLEEPSLAADEAMRTRSLTLMKKHADRIVRLVEDMLTVSRLESPDQSYLKAADFDLAQVVDDVQLRLEAMARAQDAAVHTDFTPRPFVLHGDKFYWSQVFFNLMENALKNNPAPGLHLLVRGRREPDGSARLVVEDNGVGIEADALPYIFNRFFRADKTGKIKGTGLGLSIAKHAVEAHGGRITAESLPGVRTAFIITLPPSSCSAAAPADKNGSAAPAGGCGA
ncbi:MAG: sensor histidine kinase [Akkermansia sp.]